MGGSEVRRKEERNKEKKEREREKEKEREGRREIHTHINKATDKETIGKSYTDIRGTRTDI